MPVTIMYQGSPLTFPDLDSPDEAYKQLGGQAPSANDAFAGQSADAPATDVSTLDARKEKDGIDPSLLKDNKDWLTASRALYNATQGHNWDEAKGSTALADWGLDRMARFNYNLPMMGVDALSIKNAPADEKKAFMYLLDTFEKTNYTMAGAGRFAKWAALDPMNYVGLSTFGVGTLANEGAKLTTLAGVKAALRVGVIGALEGAGYGAAQQRIDQEARLNAGGQDSIDYGQVAKGAGVGGVLGGVLAPLIAVGKNHFVPHVEEKPAITPEPTPSATPEVQGELPLGNMAAPDQAVQTRLDRVEPGLPESATQPTLPGFAQNDLSKPGAFEDLPLQRNLDKLPDQLQPAGPGPGIDEQADRLMKDWGVSHQADMFPNHPQDRRLPASATDEPIKLESSTAQGDLFDHLPTQTKDAIDQTVSKAADFNADSAGPSLTGKSQGAFERLPKPTVAEKIGGENGPSLLDLKRLLTDVGSTIDANAIKGWQSITDINSPLVRALVHMTDKDAQGLASQFEKSAMTQSEYKGYVNAAINAQNMVAHYIDNLLETRASASTRETRDVLNKKIVVAEKILDPLKTLAKNAGTTSSRTLNDQKQNLFKGVQREVNLDSILKEQGLDRHLATDEQKANALEKWFNDAIDNTAKAEQDNRLLALRQQIADAPPTADTVDLYNKLAELRAQMRDEALAADGVTPLSKLNDLRKRFLNDTASFLAHTVLSPSSLTVNTVSNAMMVFSRPALDFVVKADHVAFRQMTAAYGAMARVAGGALAQARLAFETEHSLLTGTNPKWIENNLQDMETEGGKSNLVRFLGRNGVRIWMRALNATDEFFQVMSYHGFVEGDATAKAMLAAKSQGLDKAATEALVKEHVARTVKDAYTKGPDSTTVGILRDTGIKKGLTGDNLKLYVQNQLDSNPSLLRRATNEEGISYTNDLLFKREFSGDGAASGVAKWYEQFVQAHPEMRIMGQLFFRTPVRVFEAGMRLTPGVQLVVPKFWDDLAGKNGLTREVRARGELMTAYGATASIITAYSTGNITGSGYDTQTMEQRKLVDAGWRPYSIKVGDKYISYRNYDPVSTPIKIIVNAMERLEKVQYRTAQGEMENKNSLEQIMGYVAIGTASVLQAVRDANLTSGIDDIVKMFEALNDPERKENSFKQFFGSKAQLAVPNSVRRGIKFFGDGQNVSNDPSTMDQVLENIVNPASDKVTHQFDALGNPRSGQSQGFFPYIGIDAAGREARQRGLGDRDANTLNEVAKLTLATGKTFNPTSKVGNIDLKQTMTQDGSDTLYNRAMKEFNKNIPQAAHDFFHDTEGLPTGRRGQAGPRAEAFERMHNALWNAALGTISQKEPALTQARMDAANSKLDVFQGNREVSSPFIR